MKEDDTTHGLSVGMDDLVFPPPKTRRDGVEVERAYGDRGLAIGVSERNK